MQRNRSAAALNALLTATPSNVSGKLHTITVLPPGNLPVSIREENVFASKSIVTLCTREQISIAAGNRTANIQLVIMAPYPLGYKQLLETKYEC
jgi:hypothetical protein